MAQVATNDQKTKMRGAGQWSTMYAAIFFPHTIYTARLSAVPSTTDMVAQISFDTGSGTLADVRPDMTLWVGTSAGAYDLGMCRIRKAPISGTFYIGEQSKVNWQSTCYLTVVDDFDLKAKHIHMDGTTPKMDYDVTFADQHEDFLPVPVLGPLVRVGKLINGTVDVQLGPENGDASWVIDSTISSYAWECDTATFDDDTIADPVATVTDPGWHVFYCTVGAANGKSKTGVRYVFTWDDDNLPFEIIAPPSCEETLLGNGTNFTIQLASNASLSSIPDRALCVLFSVDRYGDYLNQTVDTVGPVVGAENIEATGRIHGETITYDHEKSTVEFEVLGYHEWFKRIWGFPSGLELATNTPSAWTDMPELTVDRMLWHFLEWRCTATTIMDIKLTGDSRLAKELSSLGNNLWDQMEEMAYLSIFAHLGVDQYGRFFAEIEAQLVPEADRDWPEVMELEKSDYFAEATFDRNTTDDVSMVDLSGISVDSSGNGLSFFSKSPGNVPADYGSLNPGDKLLLEDQEQSNETAGLLYGWVTNKYKPIKLNLLNNKMLSCFPRQCVSINIESGDTIRGVSLDIRMIPVRKSLQYNPDTGFKYYEFEFEAETFEQISVTAEAPGDDTGKQGLPSLPSLPELPLIVGGDLSNVPNGPAVVACVTLSNGVIFTENFNADNPLDVKWKFWNNGISSLDKMYLAKDDAQDSFFFQTPNGAWYLGTYYNASPYQIWIGGIYRAAGLGAKWEKVIDEAWIEANEVSSTNPGILGVGYNSNKPEEVVFICGEMDSGGQKHIWIGNGIVGFTQGVAVVSNAQYAGNITYGSNGWVWDEHHNYERWVRFSADASTIEETSTIFGNGIKGFHHRFGTSPHIIKKINTDDYTLEFSEDNADTLDSVSTSPDIMGWRFACAPDGYMVGSWQLGTASKGRSSDYGATWGALSNLSPGGNYCWAWCGGAGVESRWIAARGQVWYTDDWGESWVDRKGNLTYLIPGGFTVLKTFIPGYYS